MGTWMNATRSRYAIPRGMISRTRLGSLIYRLDQRSLLCPGTVFSLPIEPVIASQTGEVTRVYNVHRHIAGYAPRWGWHHSSAMTWGRPHERSSSLLGKCMRSGPVLTVVALYCTITRWCLSLSQLCACLQSLDNAYQGVGG